MRLFCHLCHQLILKGQSMNTFLQTAKDFTWAIIATRMADVISEHFPQQYTNVLQIALELTSRARELELVSRNG